MIWCQIYSYSYAGVGIIRSQVCLWRCGSYSFGHIDLLGITLLSCMRVSATSRTGRKKASFALNPCLETALLVYCYNSWGLQNLKNVLESCLSTCCFFFFFYTNPKITACLIYVKLVFSTSCRLYKRWSFRVRKVLYRWVVGLYVYISSTSLWLDNLLDLLFWRDFIYQY